MNFSPSHGILRYLVRKGFSKRIEITTSCNENEEERPPRMILSFRNTDHWASCKNLTSNFIQIELKDVSVSLKNYSFENSYLDVAYSMNWQFLGSSDGINWNILDEHIDDNILSKEHVTILPSKPGLYRYFQIKQTGKNFYANVHESSYARYILYVRNIDLFGTLYSLPLHTCKTQRRTKPLLIICFIFNC